MKYPVFFGCLMIYLLYLLVYLQSSWHFLLIWPVCSLLIMAVAYIWRYPRLVCGKKACGRINPIMLLMNLPWLLFTWTIWGLESVFSREDVVNNIPDTNISIGRYPGFCKLTESYDLIVDLTAEFPKSSSQDGYICLPNLDGVALVNTELPFPVDSGKKY